MDNETRAAIEAAKEIVEVLGILEKQKLAEETENNYNQLVQAKKYASTEEEYRNLAAGFRKIDSYKDAGKFTAECDIRYQELKKQREEAEAKEKEERNKKQYTNAISEFQRLNNRTVSDENGYKDMADGYISLANIFFGLKPYRDSGNLHKQCTEKMKEYRDLYDQAVKDRRRREAEETAEKAAQEAAERARKARKEKLRRVLWSLVYFTVAAGSIFVAVYFRDALSFEIKSEDEMIAAAVIFGIIGAIFSVIIMKKISVFLAGGIIGYLAGWICIWTGLISFLAGILWLVIAVAAVALFIFLYLKLKLFSLFEKLNLTVLAVIFAVIGIAAAGYAGYVVYNNQENTLTISDDVTVIKEGKYARKRLISVDIPNSVTSIGDNAFMKNKLSAINIPDSVRSIGGNAFADNPITSISIGANVTLGTNAFGSDFEAFYNSKDKTVGTYRLDGSSWSLWSGNFQISNFEGNITIIGYDGTDNSVSIPAEINGQPVTIIDMAVFRDKNLASVTIPNSVTLIGDYAFSGNQLASVTIPNSVTSIGDYAFRDNQLTSVTIPNSVKSIGDGAFYDNKLTSVIIPNSVTSIGANAFCGNQLTNVIIPNSVKSIGWGAFTDNPVTRVTIGANVIFRGNYVVIDGGFNGAYLRNGNRAGTYTRPNVSSTSWTRR